MSTPDDDRVPIRFACLHAEQAARLAKAEGLLRECNNHLASLIRSNGVSLNHAREVCGTIGRVVVFLGDPIPVETVRRPAPVYAKDVPDPFATEAWK